MNNKSWSAIGFLLLASIMVGLIGYTWSLDVPENTIEIVPCYDKFGNEVLDLECEEVGARYEEHISTSVFITVICLMIGIIFFYNSIKLFTEVLKH